jgi:succinate dehydrogenase/fumarate reductase flavoprotein subunit
VRVVQAKYLNDQLVRILVNEASKAIFDLQEMGVVFERVAPTQYEQKLGGATLLNDMFH